MTGDFTKHFDRVQILLFFRVVFQFVFHAVLIILEGLAYHSPVRIILFRCYAIIATRKNNDK